MEYFHWQLIDTSMIFHILNQKYEVVLASKREWIEFNRSSQRFVDADIINGIRINTNFYGINNELFNTYLCFDNRHYIVKFATYDTYHNAENGHDIACDLIENGDITINSFKN